MINLTDEEKEKFILYLEQEAETTKLILTQMEKLPYGETALWNCSINSKGKK